MDDIGFAIENTHTLQHSPTSSPSRRRHRIQHVVDRDPSATSSKASFSSVLAGYVAGSAGLIIGHPLDSLKVLIQTGSGASASNATSPARSGKSGPARASTKPIANAMASNSSNTSSAMGQQVRGKAIAAFAPASAEPAIKSRSIMSLYAGIGTPMLSVGLIQSMNFFLYDSLRRSMYAQGHDNFGAHPLDYLTEDSLGNVFQSAFLAGGAVSVITSPLQIVKTTQQLRPQFTMKGALDHVLRGRGAKNLFVGFAPHLYCECFGRGAYFLSYEYLKREMASGQQDANKSLTLWQRMMAASVSGMSCWTIIYPADVIRCRMYALAANSSSQAQATSLEVTRSMWRTGGVASFFRGFGLTVVRAGPVAAVVLPVYDLTLERLNTAC